MFMLQMKDEFMNLHRSVNGFAHLVCSLNKKTVEIKKGEDGATDDCGAFDCPSQLCEWNSLSSGRENG